MLGALKGTQGKPEFSGGSRDLRGFQGGSRVSLGHFRESQRRSWVLRGVPGFSATFQVIQAGFKGGVLLGLRGISEDFTRYQKVFLFQRHFMVFQGRSRGFQVHSGGTYRFPEHFPGSQEIPGGLRDVPS